MAIILILFICLRIGTFFATLEYRWAAVRMCWWWMV